MNRSLKALVAGTVLAAAGLVTSTHAVAAPDPTPTTVVAVDVRCYPDGPTYSKWSVFWLVDGDPNATITSETETFGNTQGVGKPVPWSLFATYSQGTTHVSMAATTSNGQSASLAASEPAECRVKPAPSKPAPPTPGKPVTVTHTPVKATTPVVVQVPVVPQAASQSAAPVLVDQSAPPASRHAKAVPASVKPTTAASSSTPSASATTPVAAVPFTSTSTAGSDFPYVAALIIGLALLLVGAGVLFGVRHTR